MTSGSLSTNRLPPVPSEKRVSRPLVPIPSSRLPSQPKIYERPIPSIRVSSEKIQKLSVGQLPSPLSISKNPQEALIKSIEGKTNKHADHLEPEFDSPESESPISPLASSTNPINEVLQLCRHKTKAPPASGHEDHNNLNPDLEGIHAGVPFFIKPKPRSSQRWLIRMLTRVINSKNITPSQPPFKFDLSKDTARFNHELLKKYNGDIDAIIRSSPFSPMSYGSEFKCTSVLENIFQFHPDWMKMKTILMNGTSYPLKPPLPKHIQLGDLREMIAFGNHKSASGDRTELLSEKMAKEVDRGWNIPIMPAHLLDLIDAGAEIAPMGMANQGTINERGEIVMKDRVIHNQSMEGAISGLSINDRIIEEDLAPLRYGHMMSRLIHQIVATRALHPNKRILLRKDDFKSAYRRQHLNGWSALKTIVKIIHGGITFFLLSLRLTFGGCANPSEWTSIAEPICDLANDILDCDEWDPSTMHSPLQSSIPEPSFLPSVTPFTKAKPLMIGIPVLRHGYCDEYVDDVVTMGVDKGEISRRRLEAAAPLAIFVVARDIHPDEPITRENLMCMHKMQAEGALEEEKIILGWHFNTRLLLISLPENKYIAWSKQITDILIDERVKAEDLEVLIGRLNHAAQIIPLARHYLSRLRFALGKARNKWVYIPISKRLQHDLELWQKFLTDAYEGISMNLLTFRQPTHLYRTDSCELGLGGLSSVGKGWRWIIPLWLRGRAHIGLLEFLAEIVSIWLDIHDGDISAEDCALSMGDSTNAIGWVKKSNFLEEGETHHDQTAKLRASRKLAELAMGQKVKLYSQWFPGADNIIPDSLSRDWHLSDTELIALLTHLLPNQIHPNFRIVPIPKEIDSFLCSVLSDLPFNTARQTKHKTSGFGLGNSGMSSCPPSALTAMSSWRHLMNGTGKSYASPSAKPFEAQPSALDPESLNLLQEQSGIPWDMWHRPSGLLYDQTHA